ncbi:MAG: hypothetical protein KKB82_03325 [Candidatus Omnitrophica bacterium]|nr:hypothetical protein [Candidatus Omnitrophota bacterium]MBU1924937.1 hypothetical protein [Candidatus Omnitrophota bacterium]
MKIKEKILKVVCMSVISVFAIVLLGRGQTVFQNQTEDQRDYDGSVEIQDVTVPYTAGMSAESGASAAQNNDANAVLDGYVQGLVEGGMSDVDIHTQVSIVFNNMSEAVGTATIQIETEGNPYFIYSPTAIDVSIQKARSAVGSQNTTSEPVVEATAAVAVEVAAEQTQAEQVQAAPTMPASERVAQGVGQKPTRKFSGIGGIIAAIFKAKTGNAMQKEKNTTTQMINEGYSITEIAQGFKANGYSTKEIANIFEKAGVGVEDAYTALSTVALAEAQASVEQQRPGPKFKMRNQAFPGGWEAKWQEQQDTDLTAASQAALKGVTRELIDAGYDIQPALGNIATDMKANGMSAKETYKVLIGCVSDAKPVGKTIFRTSPIQTFGDGEVALAGAMMNAGYGEAEVRTAFEQGYARGGIFSGFLKQYSYSDNTVTQILQRATQATPV